MVAAHRPKSPNVSPLHTEELSNTTESTRRSPSARDRFARYISSSIASSTSRHAGSSHAARPSKPCASQDTSQPAFLTTIDSRIHTDSLLHSSDAATDGSCALWAHRSSSSSFSGAMGQTPLHSIDDSAGANAAAAAAGGGVSDGSMQQTSGSGRFASECKHFESRASSYTQQFRASQGHHQDGPSTSPQEVPWQNAANEDSLLQNARNERISSGAGLVAWALQEEIQQWQQRQQQKTKQQHPQQLAWPEQPPAWMLPQHQQQQQQQQPQQQQQQQQPPAWMLPQHLQLQQQRQQWQQQRQQQEAQLLHKQPLHCDSTHSTQNPADRAIGSVHGASGAAVFTPPEAADANSWLDLDFGQPNQDGLAGLQAAGRSVNGSNALSASCAEDLSHSQHLSGRTSRAGYPGSQQQHMHEGALQQSASVLPNGALGDADDSNLSVHIDNPAGVASAAAAAAAVSGSIIGPGGPGPAPSNMPATNSSSRSSGGGNPSSTSTGEEPGSHSHTATLAGSPVNPIGSINPHIFHLQQQLARLKKAHALVTQEVVPETPPSAIAASVAILFDTSRSDHDCSTYMQQQMLEQQEQQQQQQQQYQYHQHQQQQQYQEQQYQQQEQQHTQEVPAYKHAAAAAAGTGSAAAAGPGFNSSASGCEASSNEGDRLQIRKARTLSWPKAAGDVVPLLTDTSSTTSPHNTCPHSLHILEDCTLHTTPHMARVDEKVYPNPATAALPEQAAAAAAAAAAAVVAATLNARGHQDVSAHTGALRAAYSAGNSTRSSRGGTKGQDTISHSPIGDAIHPAPEERHQVQQPTFSTSTAAAAAAVEAAAAAGDLQACAQHFCYPSAAVAAGVLSASGSRQGSTTGVASRSGSMHGSTSSAASPQITPTTTEAAAAVLGDVPAASRAVPKSTTEVCLSSAAVKTCIATQQTSDDTDKQQQGSAEAPAALKVTADVQASSKQNTSVSSSNSSSSHESPATSINLRERPSGWSLSTDETMASPGSPKGRQGTNKAAAAAAERANSPTSEPTPAESTAEAAETAAVTAASAAAAAAINGDRQQGLVAPNARGNSGSTQSPGSAKLAAGLKRSKEAAQQTGGGLESPRHPSPKRCSSPTHAGMQRSSSSTSSPTRRRGPEDTVSDRAEEASRGDRRAAGNRSPLRKATLEGGNSTPRYGSSLQQKSTATPSGGTAAAAHSHCDAAAAAAAAHSSSTTSSTTALPGSPRVNNNSNNSRGRRSNPSNPSRPYKREQSPSGYAAALLRQQQQSANKAQAAAAAAVAAAVAAAAEAGAAAAAVGAAADAVEAQDDREHKGDALLSASSADCNDSDDSGQNHSGTEGPSYTAATAAAAAAGGNEAADAEVAAATAAAAAAQAVYGKATPAPSFSRGCTPVPPLILPTEADLMPDPYGTPDSTPTPVYSPEGAYSSYTTGMQQPGTLQHGLPQQPAAAAAAARLAGAQTTLAHDALWIAPPGGYCASPAGEGLGAFADSSAADARYAELLARLQTFMPALRSAADGDIDFETTWQLLKAELSALASAARLASLQAGRLEALDCQVVTLQQQLALLGKHIKAGAQPQQLYDLVKRSPRFNSHAGDDRATAATAAGGMPVQQQHTGSSAEHSGHRAAPLPDSAAAAAAAAAALSATQQLDTPLQQLIAKIAAAAAAAAATNSSLSGSTSNARASSSHGLQQVPAQSESSNKSMVRNSMPVQQQPWINPLYGSNRRPSPERETREAQGRQGARSPPRGRPVSPNQGMLARTPPPPSKTLTPDESARLMGLYKVRTEPQKISYKTMWVPGKTTASPHASPPRERRSPSLMSRWSPRGSRAGDNAVYLAESHSDSRTWAPAASQALGAGSSSSRPVASGSVHRVNPKEQQEAAAVNGSDISPEDTKKALHWLEQSFAGGSGSPALAVETEQIVAALRGMLGAAASVPDDNMSTRTPMRTSISFAEDVEQHHRLQRQQQQQQPYQQGLGPSSGNFPTVPQCTQLPAAGCYSPSGVHASTGAVRTADLASSRSLVYSGQRSAASSPMGFVYRPQNSKAEPQQRQQRRPRRSSDHVSASWDSSMFQGGSWGPASPQSFATRSSMVKWPRSAKLSSSPVKGSGTGGLGFRSGSGSGMVLLADDPAFLEACKAFRLRSQQQAAACSFVNSGALPRVSTAAQQLAVRLSPTKDADAQTVASTIQQLCMILHQHGVPLDIERSGTFTYTAAGRRLHVRMLNGNLLVRTGGGYQDLLDALGKLPAPSMATAAAAIVSGGSSTLSPAAAAAVAAAKACLSPTLSPRTPAHAAALPKHISADQGLASPGRQSNLHSAGNADGSSYNKLHSGGAGDFTRSHGISSMQAGVPYSHTHPTPRSRDPAVAAAGGSAAAFEAAIQAALAAAVEAAANAGLDDGIGTSGGGAGPGRLAVQHSRAALLGRVIAAKTAAGTLIEAGMCPPVPVQEEHLMLSASQPASVFGAACSPP